MTNLWKAKPTKLRTFVIMAMTTFREEASRHLYSCVPAAKCHEKVLVVSLCPVSPTHAFNHFYAIFVFLDGSILSQYLLVHFNSRRIRIIAEHDFF